MSIIQTRCSLRLLRFMGNLVAAFAIAACFSACDQTTATGSSLLLLGPQNGDLVAGTDGSASYEVFSSNIASGSACSISWYADAGASAGASEPTGISASSSCIVDGRAFVIVRSKPAAAQGKYYFAVSCGSVNSQVAELELLPDGTAVVDIGVASSPLRAGEAGSVLYQVTTKNVADGSQASICWYSDSSRTRPIQRPAFISTLASCIKDGTAVVDIALSSLSSSSDDRRYYFDIAYGAAVSQIAAVELQPNWLPIGAAGFSSGICGQVSLALSSGTVPYVAFSDQANGGKATVMSFSGGAWADVGAAGFSSAVYGDVALAISPGDVPYVAFSDASNGKKLSVMKYEANSWQVVGAADFASAENPPVAIEISKAGIPYVAFEDAANGYDATVMRYNGSAWEFVGPAGFPNGKSGAQYINLAIDSGGVPYVAFGQVASINTASLMRFDGNWSLVGGREFSASFTMGISLALSPSGIPLLSYSTFSNVYRGSASEFTDSAWASLSGSGLTSGQARYTSVAYQINGVPWILFGHYDTSTNENSLEVVRRNGSGWTTIGPASFAKTRSLSPRSLAVSSTGTPYVAFGDSINSKATVYSYR